MKTNRISRIMGLVLVLALVLASATSAFAGNNGNGKANGKGNKAQIGALDDEIAGLQAQMKQIINERYRIIKTAYSDEELAQFENAAAVIAQMYADASVLGAGSIVVKNNIIKLEAPAYMKGGRTVIPVRAITEELGATVNYDVLTKTVTVSKDGIDIVFSINSATVFVNGVEQLLDAPAEITNGRTYVPLRFIAETFGLDVSFDSETGTIRSACGISGCCC